MIHAPRVLLSWILVAGLASGVGAMPTSPASAARTTDLSVAVNVWDPVVLPLLEVMTDADQFWTGSHVLQGVMVWRPGQERWGLALPVYWRRVPDEDLRVLLVDAEIRRFRRDPANRSFLVGGIRRTWEAGKHREDHRRAELGRVGVYLGWGVESRRGRWFLASAVKMGMYFGPEPDRFAGHNLQGSKVLFHLEPLMVGFRF